jgi:hypothetical protein
MSEAETTEPLDQHPAVRDYGLVCMGALTLTVAALVLRRPDVWCLFPALLGGLGLVFRWRSGPVIVLLALVLLLTSWWLGTNPGMMLLYAVGWVVWLLRGLHGRLPIWRSGVPSRGIQPISDFLLALGLLAYAAGQYRLQGLTKSLFPPGPRRRGPDAKKVDEASRRSPDRVTGHEMGVLLVALTVCAVAASLFWSWLQEQDTDLEIADPAWQGILVLWLLGGTVLIVAAGLRYLALRRMTAQEAQLYLQDVLWRETRGEQRRLNRWLAWAWLRRRRREEKEQS